MIKELRFKNWKSFKEATLFFDPLAILIGTNASGKSNALDAIDFLARIAQSKDLAACLQSSGNGDAFRGGVDWVALRGEHSFSIEVIVSSPDPNVDYSYQIEVRPAPNPVVVNELLTRLKRRPRSTKSTRLGLFWTDTCQLDDPAITARLYNKKRGTPRQMQRGIPVLTQLQISSSSIKTAEIAEGVRCVWKALANLFILNPIPSHMRDFTPKAERLSQDGSNLAGVIAALPEHRKLEVEKTILNFVKELPEKDIMSLKAGLYGPFDSDAMLICDEGWKPGDAPLQVDSRAMSDGTLRFIAIVTALLTLPEGTQLVIEEVDNGLHPSRSDLLLRMLREIGGKRKIDILASTHNPALLDALGPEMVPFVVVAHRDPEEGHSCLTLLENVDGLPKLLARGRLGAVTASGALEQSLNPEANHGR
jgi:predicted ATPase